MTRIVGSLLGHKSRCFDVKVLKYQESTYILSSSEDGTAILWSLSETNLSKKPIFIFKPTGDTEVLRSTFIGNTIERICTCGSDGNITIWRQEVTSKASTISYKIEATLSHGIESQIYACESSVCGSLITAADNCILVWKVGSWSEAPIRYSFADPFTCLLETPRINEVEGTLTYEILHTHKFTSDNSAEVHNENVPFGGSRNADGHLLIFDVKVNPVSTHGVWLALATSSSQVYAIDISMGLLALDGEVEAPDSSIRSNQMFAKSSYSTKIDSASNNYITSVCWHSNGTLILAAMGHGQIVLLDILAECVLTIFDAHVKTCFGCIFLMDIPWDLADETDLAIPDAPPLPSDGSRRDSARVVNHTATATSPIVIQFLSWSSDTTLKKWRIPLSGWMTAGAPREVCKHTFDKFPVYNCDLREDNSVVCVGGESTHATFMGVPVLLVDMN